MQKLVTVLLILASTAVTMSGQGRLNTTQEPSEPLPYESDILSAKPIRYFIGLGLGGLIYQHTGDFIPDPEVCHCVFSDYSNSRFHYAAEFSIQYPKLGFALKFLLQYQNFAGKFQYQEEYLAVLPGDNKEVLTRVEKTSNVELAYFSVTPGFAWYIPRWPIFLLGGLEVGFPTVNEYDNLEKILVPDTLSYTPAGDTNKWTFLEKSGIPEVQSPRIGLHLGLGVDIKLTERLFVTPQAGATLPFTTISSTHSSWKVTSEYGLLIFKYRL